MNLTLIISFIKNHDRKISYSYKIDNKNDENL